MHKPKRAVIFDLDGTAVDSTESGIERLKVILEKRGIGWSSESERRVREEWGRSGAKLISLALGIPHELAQKIKDDWELVGENLPPLIPGVLETIEYLSDNQLTSTLLTSREHPSGREILERHGCLYNFALVEELGGREFEKPDPRVFIETLKFLKGTLGIEREECLYVGDTIIDVRCGLAAGVETVLVLSGPCTPEIAMAHGVHSSHVIDSVASLPAWIDSHK